jgi:hypothetical protein
LTAPKIKRLLQAKFIVGAVCFYFDKRVYASLPSHANLSTDCPNRDASTVPPD